MLCVCNLLKLYIPLVCLPVFIILLIVFRIFYDAVKTGPSIADAAMGRIAQGTKVLAEGGYEKIFQQTFDTLPEEKLKKSYVCYLSTSAGPVMGILYVSTSKLAFCSDNPLSYNVGEKTEWSYYKVSSSYFLHCFLFLQYDPFCFQFSLRIDFLANRSYMELVLKFDCCEQAVSLFLYFIRQNLFCFSPRWLSVIFHIIALILTFLICRLDCCLDLSADKAGFLEYLTV